MSRVYVGKMVFKTSKGSNIFMDLPKVSTFQIFQSGQQGTNVLR
jgi:hypothetical protein